MDTLLFSRERTGGRWEVVGRVTVNGLAVVANSGVPGAVVSSAVVTLAWDNVDFGQLRHEGALYSWACEGSVVPAGHALPAGDARPAPETTSDFARYDAEEADVWAVDTVVMGGDVLHGTAPGGAPETVRIGAPAPHEEPGRTPPSPSAAVTR